MTQRQTDLVVRAMAGDQGSFAALYEMYYRKIYSLACSMLSSTKDAEDIVQETFALAWRRLQTIKNPEYFNAWIQAIGSNLCYKHRQKKSLKLLRDAELEVGEEDMIGSQLAASEELIPAAYVEREDLRARLQMVISRLSDVQKQTITLYYYGDLKLVEIAEIMDCTVSTVNGRLRLARRAIQFEIEQWEEKTGEQFYGIAGIPMLPFGQAVVSVLDGAMLPRSAADNILARIMNNIATPPSGPVPGVGGMPSRLAGGQRPAPLAASASKGLSPVVKGITGAVAVAAVGIGIFLAVRGGQSPQAPGAAQQGLPAQATDQAQLPAAVPVFGESPAEQFIVWTDPILEAAVRVSMGIPESPITVHEAELTKTLNLKLAGEKVDLSDLWQFPRLKNLELDGGELSVAPLSGLSALKFLTLSNTQLSDPEKLSALTGLEFLCLSATNVTNLSPLSSLAALENLEVSYSDLADLAPLSGLSSLRWLCLMHTGISDLTPLEDLPLLSFVDVSFTLVTDISPVENRPSPPLILTDGLELEEPLEMQE